MGEGNSPTFLDFFLPHPGELMPAEKSAARDEEFWNDSWGVSD